MRNHKIKHPGEVLRDCFLIKFNMNPYRLSRNLRLPASRVNEIVQGRRGITAETAIRLARFFGTTAEYWLELQAQYDLGSIDPELRARVEHEVPANFAQMQADGSSGNDKI
jgi:addiction module HigA family antidote